MFIVVFAIAGGIGVTIVGYYTPFMIVGAIVMSIGAGIFLLFLVNIPVSMWYVDFNSCINRFAPETLTDACLGLVFRSYLVLARVLA